MRAERISIQLHEEHVHNIPDELIGRFERFIGERTAAVNGRLDWLNQPTEQSKLISGFTSTDVINLICAIRVGHTKVIEDILTRSNT